MPSPDPLAPITLDQYASVLACENEGIALEDALAREGIDARTWTDGAAAWNKRIAAAALADGALLDELDVRLQAARDKLARRVPPLDEDIGAWLDFLKHWSASDAPVDFLASRGLTTGDVLRLQALWGARLEADEELRKRAGEVGSSDMGPMPDVKPEPFVVPERQTTTVLEVPAEATSLPPPLPPLFGAPPPLELAQSTRRAAESPPPATRQATVVLTAEALLAASPGLAPASPLEPAPVPEPSFETEDMNRTRPPTISPFVTGALPFQSGPAPDAVRRPSVPPPPAAHAYDDLDEATRTGVELAAANPLPFGVAPPAPPSPWPEAAPPSRHVVDFPLERYARLCAEIEAHPERAEHIFASYGLGNPRARAAVDDHWRTRFAESEEEYDRYVLLFWQAKGALSIG